MRSLAKTFDAMNVDELVKELNALPVAQRMEVIETVLKADDSWVPDLFFRAWPTSKQGVL